MIFLYFFLQWDDDTKLFEIVILLFLILWTLGLNLMICESGFRVTNQFDQFDLEFNRCGWNELTIEMQRMYLIFLTDTQQPQHIKSYGGITCTRDTFRRVWKKNSKRHMYEYSVHFLFLFVTFRSQLKDFHSLWHSANFENGSLFEPN